MSMCNPPCESQIHIREFPSLEASARQNLTLFLRSGFTPLSNRTSTTSRDPPAAAMWMAVSPSCKKHTPPNCFQCQEVVQYNMCYTPQALLS